jgi:hypothetical protein
MFPPMKQSAEHVPPLQTSPEAQLVPSARFVHAVVLTPGWQLSQALPDLTVPDA